jgi:nucleoside 2-deoxyribosyltransferase
LGFIDIRSSVFTIEGLRRLDQLQRTAPNARQAFVAMWFDTSLDVAWTDGFRPGIEASQYFTAVRVDAIEHSGKIDDRIVAEIRRSGLLVADFTGDRGGVYFEAGLAQGLGIPVIWTCRDDYTGKLHFDTRQYNHIVWKDASDIRTRLENRISATLLP